VIEPTWYYAWLVVEAGVIALMLAFKGVVARFVVIGVCFCAT
jgi:hypothetical protein